MKVKKQFGQKLKILWRMPAYVYCKCVGGRASVYVLYMASCHTMSAMVVQQKIKYLFSFSC